MYVQFCHKDMNSHIVQFIVLSIKVLGTLLFCIYSYFLFPFLMQALTWSSIIFSWSLGAYGKWYLIGFCITEFITALYFWFRLDLEDLREQINEPGHVTV